VIKRLLKRGAKALKNGYSDAAGDGSWLAKCRRKTYDCLRKKPDYSRKDLSYDPELWDEAYQRCLNRRFA
jgi:hypothetical protein